ncbi:MAG TPA: HAD-IB family hydrolase [Dermatophilaceae bacterium]|nr:HAD-IB family hydrolase [Dermatophilaceae bacterium]
MAGAAFFDLDRTLLPGGTGPLLSRAMYELGVVTRKLPGERLLYGIFDTFGETLPSIFLARQATLVAKGREVATFDQAAEMAADVILALVHPFVTPLIEQHRASGRRVVLATTTPLHLVRPLADRLGFDDVIATEYGHSGGVFDGSIAGPFVWSRGKLGAVRAYAEENGIALAESFAYSDSIYDTPLLRAVGNPTAVNPDPRLAIFALARGWPIVHFDVSPGVVKVPVLGVELQRLLFLATLPQLLPYVRFDIAGTENIPRSGPAILVGNHRSYFDVMAIIQMMRHTSRTGRILAKREVLDTPLVGTLAAALGAIPVDRVEGGTESFDRAAAALAAGELVCLLPQATIPRGQAFFDPVLRGKTGAARLAAQTRATVIPFGIWGSERVWPRSSAVPDVTGVLHPPTVRIRVGAPVQGLKYRSAAADTRRLMAAVSDCLPARARGPYEPTEEELRRTHPGGRLPGERRT